MRIKNIFKITGRYVINDQFKYAQYDSEDTIFKRNEKITDRAYYYTCFYKIGTVQMDFYKDIIEEVYEDIRNNCYEYEEWEVLLPILLHKRFNIVDELGITQKIAVWEDNSKI
jgi:hypothetical protein